MILEAPAVKEGTGKELRKLHDKVQQYLRALKSIESESYGAFITSVLEIKQNVNTMFEWQQHSSTKEGAPKQQELLDFIDLREQASETSPINCINKSTRPEHKCPANSFKPIASFPAQYALTSWKTTLSCLPKIQISMDHDKQLSLLKEHKICMNSITRGHFKKKTMQIATQM